MDKDRLFLGELPKSELTMVVALTGCSDAAERQAFLGDVQQRIVDRYAAGNRPGENLLARCRVLAEPIKGQWDPLESTCRHASLSIL